MAETILIYGASGASKTTQCAEFHKYEYYRAPIGPQGTKPMQWHVTGDSGFIPMREVIEQGIVKPWNIAYEHSPVASLIALSRGMVPVHVDLSTGQRLSDEWQLCQGSMTMEGLNVFSVALKNFMAHEKKLSSQAFVDEVSGTAIGNAQLQVYGLVFDRMYALITNLKGLRIPRVMMTSHQISETGKPAGPAMVPPKGAQLAPPWFEQTLHIESMEVGTANGVQKIRALHFEDHRDPITQAVWPCKTSLTPKQLWTLRNAMQQYGGFIPIFFDNEGNLVGGITWYLSILDQPTQLTNMLPTQQPKQLQ